jgi:Ca2+-binding EF-hand superfamily protein
MLVLRTSTWGMKIPVAWISILNLCFIAAMTVGTIESAVAQQDDSAEAVACPCSYERIAFEAADTNDDGLVSEAEFARDAATGFSTLDKDGSLTLTPEELGPHDPAKFSRLDANGNGALTFSEVMANKIRALQEGDKNRDGGLSFEEMMESVEAEEGIGR